MQHESVQICISGECVSVREFCVVVSVCLDPVAHIWLHMSLFTYAYRESASVCNRFVCFSVFSVFLSLFLFLCLCLSLCVGQAAARSALEQKLRLAEEQVRLAKEQAESEAAARAVSHTQESKKKAEEEVAAAKKLADQEAAARRKAEEEETARKKAEALAEAARAEKAGVLYGVWGDEVNVWELGEGVCSSL